MTLTNGQDQSVEFRREVGRQSLKRGREESFLPSQPEERGSARPLSVGFGFERTMARHEGTAPIQLSPWTIGVEYEPATEGKGYPVNFPFRSRQKPTGLAEGYKTICERWSLDAPGIAKLLHLEEESGLCNLILSGQVPPMTGDLKDRMALVIGISIGLGELFRDDKDAELQWLTSERSELGGVSPLEHMLKGDLLNLRDVVDFVDNARGLR